MKKVWLIICLFLFIPGVFAETKADLAPNSKSAILMDFDTGKILYSKNDNEVLPPASMTKIMSMLLIMERIDNKTLSLTDEVTISENAASMGGSQVFLQAGETYKVEELLQEIAAGNRTIKGLAAKFGLSPGSMKSALAKLGISLIEERREPMPDPNIMYNFVASEEDE